MGRSIKDFPVFRPLGRNLTEKVSDAFDLAARAVDQSGVPTRSDATRADDEVEIFGAIEDSKKLHEAELLRFVRPHVFASIVHQPALQVKDLFGSSWA